MTEPGATSTIANKEDELVPELLVAQRKELQDEVSSINIRLEQAGQTLSAEQAEELEPLRERRDNLVVQMDKIDAMLAKANPDVLSDQAASLSKPPRTFDTFKTPLDPREFHEEDLPLVKLSDHEEWATAAEKYEKKNGPEAEEALIAELDAKLLSLIRKSAEIVDKYEQKRIDMEKEKADELQEINAEKTRLMQDKKAYFTIKRQRDEVIERLKKDAEYN